VRVCYTYAVIVGVDIERTWKEGLPVDLSGNEKARATKKPWAEPKLILHGDVEHITQDKSLGLGDGIILKLSGPIGNPS
jgi:hypothetical protein